MMNATQAIAIQTEMPTLKLTANRGPAKVKMLLLVYGLSLRDVCDGANRVSGSPRISRSQLHRVLHGQQPTPCERSAIAAGINECLRQRCDSAYLFGD